MINKEDTLFINFFAGPGAGKSTTAAGVFFMLKAANINAEYVPEYAKDLVWADRQNDLICQPYVTSKQLYRQYRINGKVDVAVVDSPILLGAVYGGFGATPAWRKSVFEQFDLFNNLNIVLSRDTEEHPYNPKGRNQTVDEAIQKDNEVLDLLNKNKIPYIKMAPMPLEVLIEVISDLAFLLKFETQKPIYGVYYEENGQRLFTDFTNDDSSLEFLQSSLPDDKEGFFYEFPSTYEKN
jgi:hypothetical protein